MELSLLETLGSFGILLQTLSWHEFNDMMLLILIRLKISFIIPTHLAPGVLLCKDQFLFSERLASASCHPEKKSENIKQHLKLDGKQIEWLMWFSYIWFLLDWTLSSKKATVSSLVKGWGYRYRAPLMYKKKPTGCSYSEYQGDQHYCVNK